MAPLCCPGLPPRPLLCLNAENGALCSLSLTCLSLSLLCVSLAMADVSWSSITVAALLAPAFLCPNQPRRCWPQQGHSRPLSATWPRDAVVLAVDEAAAAGNAGLAMLCCCAAAACCLAGQGQAWPRRPTTKPQHAPLWPPKSLSSRPSRPPAGHHALRPFCETRKDFALEFKKREGSFCKVSDSNE